MDDISLTPHHIAIIMDGNGRWARARDLPRSAGHQRGVETAAQTYRACQERGVPYLTLYAFSFANWNRPDDEVAMLMRLCGEFCADNVDDFVKRGIRLDVIGDLDELPTEARHKIEAAKEATSGCARMTLTLALGYGCRNDLIGAVRAIAAHAQAGILLPEEIDEGALRRFMTTRNMPDPDLVIRTGGEKRLSDFLLYESAMSELFFCDEMWPEFTDDLLEQAITAYGRRQRRFGRTPEQIVAAAV